MANQQRGETVLQAGERQIKLALTLGAMAEIEDAFQVDSIDELAERLKKPKIKDLLTLVRALSIGGGEEVSEEDLRRLPILIPDVQKAVTEVLQRAETDMGDGASGEAPKPGRKRS